MAMRVELLNHSCVIISFEQSQIKLLCDPWLFGTCFEGGWGLRYDNPEALEKAAQCTHLWISHFHTDHFHFPTLKALLEINPDIVVLGNHSFNFQLDGAMRGIGFKNVLAFGERSWLELGDGIRVMRYPTTGIDNMLVLEGPEGRLLNYNDCNITKRARNWLAQKIGPVDVLLNNFNHANKLMDHPPLSHEPVMAERKQHFTDSTLAFNPSFTIPFASFHYYKAPESQEQNKSLLDSKDLVDLLPNVVDLGIGQTVSFDKKVAQYEISAQAIVTENQRSTKQRQSPKTFEELEQAAAGYIKKVNRGFLKLTALMPMVCIRITDLDRNVGLTFSDHTLVNAVNEPLLEATSEELYTWWTKPYGTDSFVVGAHFDVLSDKAMPMRLKFLVSLLTENKLDVLSILIMLVTPKGWEFLWNRREEILGLVLGGTKVLKVGTRK